MKSKRVLTILLSLAIMLTFMPTMAFATDSSTWVVTDVSQAKASVRTDDSGDDPVYYDTFAHALEATNVSANVGKNAVITLMDDADYPSTYFVTPLKIDLGDYKLTGLPEDGPCDNLSTHKLCLKKEYKGNVVKEVLVREHSPEYIFDWDEDGQGGWKVVSYTWTCDNCTTGIEKNQAEINALGTVKKESVDGKYIYNFYSKTTPSKILSSFDPDEAVESYVIASDAVLVRVNDRISHKDGLPLAEATVRNTKTNEVVPATVAVTAATDDEIKAWNKQPEVVKVANKPATCTTEGWIAYKLVVTDPDGNVVKTVLRTDDQATKVTDHEAGKLQHIELLVKHGKNDSTSEGYTSEAEALLNAEGKNAVKTTEEKTGWYYWTWKSNGLEYVQDSLQPKSNNYDATNPDGSFTYRVSYYCMYDLVATSSSEHKRVDGNAISVDPLPYPETASDGLNHDKYSDCTTFYYPTISIPQEYYTSEAQTVKTKTTTTIKVHSVNRVEALHASDGTQTDPQDPTCEARGSYKTSCPICGQQWTVYVPATGNHKYDLYGDGKQTTAPLSEFFKEDGITTYTQTQHIVTVTNSEDVSTATVAPTCTEEGGIYKWCKKAGTSGHWAFQSKLDATGHKLAAIASEGHWATTPDSSGLKPDYEYVATYKCTNASCPNTNVYIHYHSSKAGVETALNKFGAVDIVNEDKGADCQTQANVIYTVKDGSTTISTTTGPVVVKVPKGKGTVGAHKYTAKKINWSDDLEAATATVECSVCGHSDREKATVTKETAANGLTTFTATYGGPLGGFTDTKTGYSMKGAVVTFDKTAITDGNLVTGVGSDGVVYGITPTIYGIDAQGYVAAQTPEVTLKINGTVIDPSAYKAYWVCLPVSKEYAVRVTWSDEVDEDQIADKNDKDCRYAVSDISNTAFKKVFKGNISADVTVDGEEVTEEEKAGRAYKKGSVTEIKADTSAYKKATVKYAVTTKEVTSKASEIKADAYATQKKIEALDYNLDKVELTDVNTYYVYAQVTQDGYTTKTFHLATYQIAKDRVVVFIDNATSAQGKMPELKWAAYRYTGTSAQFDPQFIDYDTPVTIDPADITIKTAGDEELDTLAPGTYKMIARAAEYFVINPTDDNIAKLTVVEDADKEAEAKADAEKAAGIALANASNIANSDKYTADSVNAIKAAMDALNKTLSDSKSTSTQIKAATDALNKAVSGVKLKTASNFAAKKAKKVLKAKSSKTTKFKAKKAFKLSGAAGKVTYKKVKGNKKIKVSSSGKVTVKKGLKKGKTYKVKVAVTDAGNGNVMGATKNVTLKIKVK